MTSTQISTPGTVDELMAPDSGNWGEHLVVTQGGPAFAAIARSLPPLDGLLTNVAAVRAIAGRIPELLRLDLGVILVGGWKKVEELRGYTNTDKYAPTETILVELTRHRMESVHKPTLDVMVNGAKLDTIKFEIKIEATIDGAVLTIRGGKIHAVAPGACKCSLELKCEGYSMFKREPAPIRLPVSWTLKQPLAIPPIAVPEKP